MMLQLTVLQLVLLAAGPAPNSAPKPTDASNAPAAVSQPCSPIAVDLLKQQAAHLVVGKATAVKEEGNGITTLTLKVATSWKGAVAGADLTVRDDAVEAKASGAKAVHFKKGESYFLAAQLPALGMNVAAVINGCGATALEADATGVIWELNNGPIEQAARVAVFDLLTDKDPDVRLRAINRIAEFKDNDVGIYTTMRERALKDTDATVRLAAARQVGVGAIAGKIEFKVLMAMLAMNDPDIGTEICHSLREGAAAKDKKAKALHKKAISALQKLKESQKDKAAKQKLRWDAKRAQACLEGNEHPDQAKDFGDYDGAWGK